MDSLTWFGLVAVTLMLVCYTLEDRSHWRRLGVARTCPLGLIYGFLQGAWPLGAVDAIWPVIAPGDGKWKSTFGTRNHSSRAISSLQKRSRACASPAS